MVRPGREKLSGTVEADETYIGAPQEGKPGRGAYGKRLVFVAVERKGARMGRIRMECIPDASGDSLQVATRNNIASGTVVRTDGWGGYNWMGKASSPYSRIKVNEIDEEVANASFQSAILLSVYSSDGC